MSYIQRICDLSRRGDMKTISDMMKGYYLDNKKHPWDKISKNILTFLQKELSNEKQSEILILVRAAIFGALDILSFGLIQEIATEDILNAFTKEEDWKLGRRNARNLCLDIADKLISERETRYLIPSALERDGFGFLNTRIEEARWEEFEKAKPTVVKGKLKLGKLEKSVIGSKFLREQMIMDTEIDANDEKAEALLEAYELQLVELEVDRSSRIKPSAPTEQITLNGKPVFENDEDEEKEEKTRKKTSKADQTPLTDFLSEEKKSSKTAKKRSTKKKGGRKK